VKEKVIFLTGIISGYLREDNAQIINTYSPIDNYLFSGEVRNISALKDLDFEEYCTGFFFRAAQVHKLKFFIEDSLIFQDRVKHFVIRDISLGEKIKLDNTDFVSFQGKIYLKLSRPILMETLQIRKELMSTKKQNVSSLANTNIVIQLKHFIQRSSFYSSKNIFQDKPINFRNSLRLSIYVSSILTLALGLTLNYICAPHFLNFLIPFLFFFFIITREGIKKISRLNNIFGVKYPLVNALAWLLIIANLAIMVVGVTPHNLHGLLLGVGFFLCARFALLLRVFGAILLILQFISYHSIIADYMSTAMDDLASYNEPKDPDIVRTYFETEKKVTDTNDTILVNFRVHKLKWKDNFKKRYDGVFKVRNDHYYLSKYYREQYNVNAFMSSNYWHEIYDRFTNENVDFLASVVSEYKRIIRENNLNREQAADMVVTSIQNIPYFLVHDLTHARAEKQYGGFILNWHEKGGYCLELTKFGLQTPTEFMGNFKGDCDTRSVLLHHVLVRLGYKTVILTSDKYGHAIIGISGNYRGKHLVFKGINYYTWETTFPGYAPGVLSNECGNIRYWKVALPTYY